jgi:hypothetical protein
MSIRGTAIVASLVLGLTSSLLVMPAMAVEIVNQAANVSNQPTVAALQVGLVSGSAANGVRPESVSSVSTVISSAQMRAPAEQQSASGLSVYFGITLLVLGLFGLVVIGKQRKYVA